MARSTKAPKRDNTKTITNNDYESFVRCFKRKPHREKKYIQEKAENNGKSNI